MEPLGYFLVHGIGVLVAFDVDEVIDTSVNFEATTNDCLWIMHLVVQTWPSKDAYQRRRVRGVTIDAQQKQCWDKNSNKYSSRLKMDSEYWNAVTKAAKKAPGIILSTVSRLKANKSENYEARNKQGDNNSNPKTPLKSFERV